MTLAAITPARNPIPGRGWAFSNGPIGPVHDRQIALSGKLALSLTRTVRVEMRIPADGGVLNVKIKDPANNWKLLAHFELPPVVDSDMRSTIVEIDGTKYQMNFKTGLVRDGTPCIHIRMPDIVPMDVPQL